MGRLEERFFNFKHDTLIKPGDERAEQIIEILGPAIIKGNYIDKCGQSTKYYFILDKLYDPINR